MNAIAKAPSPTASTDAAPPEQLLAAMTLPGADIAALAQQFKLALAGKSSGEQTTNAPALFTARDSFAPREHGTESAVPPLATLFRSDAPLESALDSDPAFVASRSQ